jgi:hypothetical protein
MSNTKIDSPADEADPFLAEIRKLRGGKEAEGGEDWVERAVDLKVDQLLDLSECLREMVTGRLGGEAAVGQTDAFLCKAASLIMERLMGEIEE